MSNFKIFQTTSLVYRFGQSTLCGKEGAVKIRCRSLAPAVAVTVAAGLGTVMSAGPEAVAAWEGVGGC